MLEGTLEAHGDLLADSKKRTEQLEDQLGVWQTKHAEDTDACAAALKDEQHAKASCVGSYAESDTIIGDLKKTLGALETNLNATTAKLEATVDTCDRTIKSCQGEKQKCVGESAAHAALLADVKENASVLAAKLHTTQGAFEKTTTELTSEIDTCQADKQRCVGESKAAHDLITECVDTRAELQTQLATKAVANAKLAHETSAAMKTCQDEKQTCIGTNKASLTLIADCKATAGDFEDELGATTAALAETTAKFETELKQLQTEKQTCVGQNKASQTVIADLKSATADLENTLNKTTSTLTETAAQCDADVQQLQTEKQACVGHNKASLTLLADYC
jgi:septal ring factor EnvC (AmiA/AmiB activator)